MVARSHVAHVLSFEFAHDSTAAAVRESMDRRLQQPAFGLGRAGRRQMIRRPDTASVVEPLVSVLSL